MVWTPRSKLLIPGIAALLALSACGADKEPESARDTTPTTVTPTTATTTAAPTDGSCAYNADGMPVTKQIDPPPAQPAQSGRVKAAITTNAGIFNVTLDAANAPCTVNSFVSLSEQGFYDDTSCHRLTTEGIFVLQCGDPTGTGMAAPVTSTPMSSRAPRPTVPAPSRWRIQAPTPTAPVLPRLRRQPARTQLHGLRPTRHQERPGHQEDRRGRHPDRGP
jgi:hypothetical protein